MDNNLRTEAHKRLKGFDELLKKINGLFEEIELRETSQLKKPRLPAVFLVGNPRSGTTLLYQWLAATGLFAFPSNIMSRFYKAPYIGGLLHQIFIDFDKHGEICGKKPFEFISQLGKTKGGHSPHEFWHFWRRFFHFSEIQRLNEAELAEVNHKLFLKELAAIEKCFEKPLLLKALILNWNIDYLNQILPKSLFLFIKRNEIHNMASLYKARKIFFNDPSRWYSFKPPEYEKLKNKNVYLQLAGQVYYTNKFIEKQLKRMPANRSILISYEKFCKAPEQLFNQLVFKLKLMGYGIDDPYNGPDVFQPNSKMDEEFSFKEAQIALKNIKVS